MKLYVNENRTKWAGTQADAKKELGKFEAYDVPVDKSGMLAFLNREAGFNIYPEASEVAEVAEVVKVDSKAELMSLHEVVQGCKALDLGLLSTALEQLLFKAWNEREKIELAIEDRSK